MQRTVNLMSEFIKFAPNTEKVICKSRSFYSLQTIQFISTSILKLPKALLNALNSTKWKLNILNWKELER